MEDRIIRSEYSEIMQKSYIDYAMSVIVSRALLYKGVPKEKNDFKGNNKQSDGINLATIGKALDNQKKIHD